MKQREEIRANITSFLIQSGQMPKRVLFDMVYNKLTVTRAEINAEWAEMKKEGIVYCVHGLPGWVGIFTGEK